MNSLTTRVLAAATVGALAVSLAAPSFAASRVKQRTAPPAEQSEDAPTWNAQVARPGAPAIIANQPNACFTDEGYGRFASCDQAGD